MAMQTAVEAAEKVKLSVLSASTASMTSERTGETPELLRPSNRAMRRLWERMAGIFPAKWCKDMGETPMSADKPDELSVYGDTWARGLAGFSNEQIAKGLEKALERGGEWPPSLPVFQCWCFGIPSYDEVRAEFLPGFGGDRSQFGRLVYMHLDVWAWRHSPTDRSDRMLREAYSEAVRHVRAGGELPAVPIAGITQEQPRRRVASPETAEAAIRDIAAILGIAP